MVMAKPVMLVPSREIICPTHTTEKPNMPVGRFEGGCKLLINLNGYTIINAKGSIPLGVYSMGKYQAQDWPFINLMASSTLISPRSICSRISAVLIGA